MSIKNLITTASLNALFKLKLPGLIGGGKKFKAPLMLKLIGPPITLICGIMMPRGAVGLTVNLALAAIHFLWIKPLFKIFIVLSHVVIALMKLRPKKNTHTQIPPQTPTQIPPQIPTQTSSQTPPQKEDGWGNIGQRFK